ncbi:MAG: hypothetical protein GKR91_01825 [Pseudomonadales bacterium]|nr:hypothetical protein [Pseudomonadales bacterium]
MVINRINLQQILPHLQTGSTLLVPNLRIKDAILSQYLTSLDQAVLPTPKVVPVDVFIKECWETNAQQKVQPCNEQQILSPGEEYLLWNRVLAAAQESIPLLNPDETADTVAHSYQLARQWLHADTVKQELAKNSGLADVSAFAQWIEEFHSLCEKFQSISLVDAIATLTELLQDQRLTDFPGKIVLVNFYDPPPLYQKFFAAMPNLETVLTIDAQASGEIPGKQRFEFENINSEIRACAKWAKKQLESNPHTHLGIISCNKDPDRQKLELALRDELEPESLYKDYTAHPNFNSSSNPKRLADSAMVHDALLILGLGNERHDVEDLIRLLQSPFLTAKEASVDSTLAADGEREARLNLVRHLRRRAQASIGSRELSYLVEYTGQAYHCKVLASQLVKLRTETRKIKNRASPRQWSELFQRSLSLFSWPGRLSSKDDYQLLKQWRSLLSQFGRTANVLPALNYHSALTVLRLLCTRTAQHNQFNASQPISFYTIEEAIGLEFEHVWLLGLNDQQWPEPVTPSPFLPYATQKEAGIPGSHSEVQIKNARNRFAQLLASARVSVQASYFKSDGEQEFRGSSFIQDFPIKEIEAGNIQLLNNKALSQIDSLSMETITDDPLPLKQEEEISGGASLISDQSNCPFRAFAKHRLRVDAESAIEAGLSKMARGSAIHIALESLFERIDSSIELNALTDAEILLLLQSASAKAIDYLVSRFRDIMTPGFQRIEQQRIHNLLNKFVQAEKARPPFKVLLREHALGQRIDNLSLNIRIDRIDRLENDALLLVDYKTGKYTVSSKSWLDDRPEDMQLPLYYVIADNNELQPVDAVGIAHINAEKIGHSGVAATNSFSKEVKPIEEERWSELSWSQTTESWAIKVQLFAAEFNRGDCAVSPVDTTKTCTYCGLQSLCRIQELTDNDVLAAEGEN